MTNDEVTIYIFNYLANVTGMEITDFTLKTNITDEGILDSIQLIQFLFQIEEQFDVSLDIEMLAQCASIEQLLRQIR